MRYAKYKPTGIAWLPEVPEEWECVRLGVLGSFSNGLSKEAEAFGSGQPFVSYGDVYRNYALPKEIKGLVQSTSAEQEACSLRRGDVLFTRTSESIDEIGFSSACLVDLERATFAGFLIRYRPRTETIVPEFSKYYFRNCRLRTYFRLRISGIITRASLSQSVLRGLPVMLPPLPTQRAIVAFLDEKCGKVDRLVAAKEKEVALLKELKQSMIAEAVTRGIRENRHLVASGIPWLPEVPEGWEVLRNKTFLKLTDEKVGDRKSEFVLLSLTKQGVIIRDLTEMKGKFPKDFDTYLVVRPNNLVFCLFDVDETPRTVGLVRNVGMLTGAYTNFELDATKVLPEFAYYFYLQVDDAKKLRPYYTGLRKVVKTNTFLQLRMPVPPLAEQREIVVHIEAKAAKIDAAVLGLEREVAALKEYKQRLIADVVTGQRRVA